MSVPQRLIGVLAAVAVSAGVATAAPVATVAPAQAAAPAPASQPPQQDAFYQPPPGFEDTKPGTILRTRKVTIAAGAAWPIKVKAWQLLYRTTDAQGRPMATVTTAMLPGNAKPDRNRPLLAYQVAQNSIPPNCAPSYQLRQSFNWDNVVPQIELLLIAASVRQGWAVTVPDHLGQQGAYTAGKVSGHATLDAVRATENFREMGLNGADTRVGMWGYSGGAHASGWAAQLQPDYAPELDVRGVATGGIPADLEPVYEAVNGGPFSGIALTAIAGLSRGYPELAAFLDEHLTAAGRAAFAKVTSQCLTGNAAGYAFKDIDKYLTIEDPLRQPVPQRVLADARMDGRADTPPMFVYHSVNDQLVPGKTTDRLVQDRCAAGNQVTYRRDVLSEHIVLTATGAPDALDWLKQRLDGTPAAPGCSTKTVASSLATPKAFALFGKILLDTLIDLAGRPVGPPS